MKHLFITLLLLLAGTHAFANTSSIMGETIYEKNVPLYGLQARCVQWASGTTTLQCEQIKIFILSPHIEIELRNTINIRDLILLPEQFRKHKKKYDQIATAVLALIGGTRGNKPIFVSTEIFKTIQDLGGEPQVKVSSQQTNATSAESLAAQTPWIRIGSALSTKSNNKSSAVPAEQIELFCLPNTSIANQCDAFQLFKRHFGQVTALSKVFSPADWLTAQRKYVENEMKTRFKAKRRWCYWCDVPEEYSLLFFIVGIFGLSAGIVYADNHDLENPYPAVAVGMLTPFALFYAGYGIVELRNHTVEKRNQKRLKRTESELAEESASILELANGVVNNDTILIEHKAYTKIKEFFIAYPNTASQAGGNK